jgi:hypothetical protein
MEAHASALAMTQQPDRQLDPSLPNAARMQAIGDLLARGIRRLNDMKRRKVVWDTADAGFTAIKNSYFNNTAISLLILDAATGGQGLDADFMVTKFTREEPLDEAIVVKVTAKPTLSTRSPTWHAGSSVTTVES